MKETQEIKKADGEQQTLPSDPPLEERVGEDNEVPDIETLWSENEELKFSLRLREARDEMESALKAAGARSPELLFYAARESLKFGENGRVENPKRSSVSSSRSFRNSLATLDLHRSTAVPALKTETQFCQRRCSLG